MMVSFCFRVAKGIYNTNKTHMLWGHTNSHESLYGYQWVI